VRRSRVKKKKRRGKRIVMSGYNGVIEVDPYIMKACETIVSELRRKKVVRNAFLVSAFRSGQLQCRMLTKNRKIVAALKARGVKIAPVLVAPRSSHPLGLACDVYFILKKKIPYRQVVLEARRVLDGIYGEKSKRIRIWREQGIGAIHVDPNYYRSNNYYRIVRQNNVQNLIKAGVLPANTSTNRNPLCHSYGGSS